MIDRSFFARPALEVAPEVFDGTLSHTSAEGQVSIRITEVEVYDGPNDPAAHTYRGRTVRNETMFGPPGHLYCYLSYGIHHNLNMVCGQLDIPTGVLLRAGEVTSGTDLARHRRTRKPRKHPLAERSHARGPGCLAECFRVDLTNNGDDLFGEEWAFIPATPPAQKITGPRVGVSGPGADPDRFPCRFHLPDEPTVSAFVPGKVKAR
ncbi:MAG: DNA-3-methyladenine glycosylase [Acidimicrobiia bacterium]|nr:DNA-3-methyladenine glycosylase [Acidimicrobiia bacterium]